MKKYIIIAVAILFAFSCGKEENKSGYYNPDGSPLTWEQARNLTESFWSMFDVACISMDILPPSTRIKQPFADKLGSDLFYSPPYNSWAIVMNPVGVNGVSIFRYVFVNSETGEIYIDPNERECDYESFEWRVIKTPPGDPIYPQSHLQRQI